MICNRKNTTLLACIVVTLIAMVSCDITSSHVAEHTKAVEPQRCSIEIIEEVCLGDGQFLKIILDKTTGTRYAVISHGCVIQMTEPAPKPVVKQEK